MNIACIQDRKTIYFTDGLFFFLIDDCMELILIDRLDTCMI